MLNYDLTGDVRSLESAIGMAQFTLSHKDEWWRHLKSNGARCLEAWVSEPMSMLYGLTGDSAYVVVDFGGIITSSNSFINTSFSLVS